MDFKTEIIALLSKKIKLKKEELGNLVAVPPDPKLGDYAFPCFKLGKSSKAKPLGPEKSKDFSGNPKQEAEKLKEKIELPTFLAKIEVAGPYLNFFIKHSFLAEETLTKVYQQAKNYGKQDLGKGKKIVIDFSSPNIAKPFGIGHLRSTVIGSSLYKIYHCLGYNVIGVNHLGDWGMQFGKLIVAYKKWGEEKELEKEPIKYLLRLYVRFHQEAEKNPALEEEARAWFKKLEDNDKEALALWEDFRELSLQEFKKIYRLLDVEFDSYQGEAFYNQRLDQTITELQKKVKTEISEQALIVNLKKYNLPPLMLRKSDGATTYATRDLAAVFYRLRQYKPCRIIYVVGSEQRLHFQQLFKTLELVGLPSEKCIHIDFGLFKFPEGKMSTRKGNVIFLEEVLDKAIGLAEQIIEKKNPSLNNKKETAKQVGVGAIIFADLSTDRIRDVDFYWEKFLSFEGETAPYIQYTHARACSILRKAHQEKKRGVSAKISFETFNLAPEQAMVKLLYDFPQIIVRAAETYKPHHLAQYLLSLAHAFNEFYHQCPVISEQKQTMKARLLLVDCVRQVLENGLGLLGIKAPEEM